jgi:hypothetical protein
MPKGKGTYGKKVGRPPKPKPKGKGMPKKNMIVKNGTKKPMKKGSK